MARPPRWFTAAFALACAAVVSLEALVVFADNVDSFTIEGTQVIEVTEFSRGATVSQAFLMTGDGMRSVSVMLTAASKTSEAVRWQLWRGNPDQPGDMTLALDDARVFDLRAGRQWVAFALPRDGSSDDRWYTLRVRLHAPQAPGAPVVQAVASQDNPDRGGVLWIDDRRQTGSLMLRAERQGRTLYRRFRAEAEPHLPSWMRAPTVQWGVVLLFHWAAGVLVYALLREAWPPAPEAP